MKSIQIKKSHIAAIALMIGVVTSGCAGLLGGMGGMGGLMLSEQPAASITASANPLPPENTGNYLYGVWAQK